MNESVYLRCKCRLDSTDRLLNARMLSNFFGGKFAGLNGLSYEIDLKSVEKLTDLGLKGSRQREKRGFGKVSNIRNMSQTAAIDVLFSFNFTVVFDFMYFRFRPGKAK
jgi:hypothetical protein